MISSTALRRIPARASRSAILSSLASVSHQTRWFASAVPVDPDLPAAAPPAADVTSTKDYVGDANAVDDLLINLRPSQVVQELDRHIVGQADAKRAVAIAMRNRWRRKQLPDDLRKEVTPRNVLLVGPTGCGMYMYHLRVLCVVVFFG